MLSWEKKEMKSSDLGDNNHLGTVDFFPFFFKMKDFKTVCHLFPSYESQGTDLEEFF